MTLLNNNDTLASPKVFELTVSDDDDNGPFIGLSIEEPDDYSKPPIVDATITTEAEADALLQEVSAAVAGFKKRLLGAQG